MSKTTEIYLEYEALDHNDYKAVIKLHNSHILYFDNKTTFENEDEFNDYCQMIFWYGWALESGKNYSKTTDYLKNTLLNIENNIKALNINIYECKAYWSILAIKGRAHFRKKEYTLCIQTYNKLIQWEPDNEDFKEWLIAAKSRKLSSVNKYLYFIAIILFIIEIFVGKEIKIPNIKLYLSGIGFILIIVALITDYFGDRIIKFLNRQ